MTRTPIYLTEQKAEFEQRWACEPPAEGSSFKVIRDEWTEGDPPVRTIFEWQPAS